MTPSPKLFFYLLCIAALLCLYSTGLSQKTSTSCDSLQITDFKIFNSELPVDSILKLKTIELSSQQNSFSIGYRINDSLENTNYYYQLEGSDKNWIKAVNSSVINYTMLPPGKYNFKIRCENKTTGVNREFIALRTSVNIPFWLSGWFIILCFVFFVGAVYYLHSLRIKRLLAIETVRQKVSRDLHDDIGSTLSTINILSMMAKAKLQEDPSRALEYINKIGDNSSRMMEAMDDIVWSINPVNDNMQKIMARMRSFATEVLESKDIDSQFYFDEALCNVHLDMEARRDLFLLFKEAVNNAAKYSNATQLIISMRLINGILQLVVEDNGQGFITRKPEGGNGLNNMQKRAERLKSKYSIASVPDKGTRITVEMPIT
jgi:two-component sensor histidine kinase